MTDHPRTALLVPLLVAAAATACLADKRAGIDYHEGRAVVSFTMDLADRLQPWVEGRASLAQVTGDDSLQALMAKHGVTRVHRLFELDDFVIENRGNRTPAQAYWDHVAAVDARFAARKARAPRWVKHIATYGIFLLHFPETVNVFDVVRDFAANPHVEYAEELTILRLTYDPNDPDWTGNNLWGTVKIGCKNAWDTASNRGQGIVVAVIDTGIRHTHEDLTNERWVNTLEQSGSSGTDDDGNGYDDDIYGYDFGSGDSDPADNHGHGSHCSGTIGAEGDNSLGIVGIAFNCKIMACKIFGSGGSGDPVVNALDYSRANGADVNSNSYGGAGYGGNSRATAINNCLAAGVIPVFAAGNDNLDGAIFYPASNWGAISVAASTSSDTKASFSCYGMQLDVTAPGTSIRSCTNSGDSAYANWQGTSMACPHVAGACALFLSYCNDQSITLTAEQIRSVLRKAAVDVNGPGWSTHSGYGRLDVDAMINLPNLTDVPEVRITSPDFLVPVSGSNLTVTGTARHPNTPGSFSGYRLEYAWGKAAKDADRWETVNTSSTGVSGGTLGTLGLTGLPNGRYTLRLAAEDSHNRWFLERIEFVRDTHGDGSSSSAVVACATPVTNHTDYFAARNLQPAGDLDWFRFELVNGQTYEFRTRNLYGNTDTEIYLYRNNGTTLIASNDDYPSAGLKESRVQWTCDGTNTYYVRIKGWEGSGYSARAGTYDLRVTGRFRDAYERDGSSGAAAAHALGQPAAHNLVPAGDVDWAGFAAVAGRSYTIQCSAFSGARVRLYDTNGSSQIGSDAATDGDGYYTINWTCPGGQSGTYYVRVESTNSTQADYVLTIYEAEDVFFFDDFQSTNSWWSSVSGTWAVSSGAYSQTDTTAGQHNLSAPAVPGYDTFVIEADVTYDNVSGTAADASAGFVLRYDDQDSFLVARVKADDTVEVARWHQGQYFVLDSASYNTTAGTAFHLRVLLQGTDIHMFVNGRLLVAVNGYWFPGSLALHSIENDSTFDDVKVYWYRPASTTQFSVKASLADGEYQETYSDQVLQGGTTPYNGVTLLSGSVPNGLTLNSNGTLTGTPTAKGNFSFTVEAMDDHGRLTTGTTVIDVYDTIDPVLTVNGPADGLLTAQPNQTLDVDVADHSPLAFVEYRINTGTWTTLTFQSGTNWTAALTLPEGLNTIDIRTEDEDGNDDSDQIQVTYDPYLPWLDVSSHADDELSTEPDVTLAGSFLNCVTLTVNGAPAVLNTVEGTWSLDVTLAYGANAFAIVGTDTYSRTMTVNLTLHHRLMGDIDNDQDVDEDDALMAVRAEAGMATLTAGDVAVGDMDGNGVVDVRDAYEIRRLAGGGKPYKD